MPGLSVRFTILISNLTYCDPSYLIEEQKISGLKEGFLWGGRVAEQQQEGLSQLPDNQG